MSAPRNRKSTGEKRRSRSLVAEAYQTLKGQILDNRLGPGEQYLEGDLSERLANTSVTVKAPTGITADPKQIVTDANGEFSFEVELAKGTLATEVILLVDQRFSITVNVIPDN